MDLSLSPELEEFRIRTRAFIAEHAPKINIRRGVRAPEPEDLPALRQWNRDLYEGGYLGGDWPEEWGGRPGRNPLEEFVLSEEMARADAPIPLGAGGLAAGALLSFGTEEQKARYLPRIRTSEDLWCQLFSEPNAGSDLASLQTRARRDGDSYIVDGQKVWTTNGQHANLGYLLARTDPDVDKHAGITAFVLDMTSPGVDVRPLREITGTSDFNEVFLDGVVVPAENVIGEPNAGWRVTTMSLVHERLGVASAGIRLKGLMTELIDLARRTRRVGVPANESADVRQALARLHSHVQISNCLGYVAMTHHLRGTPTLADAPIGKLFFSELNLAMAEFGLELQNSDSVLTEDDPRAFDSGRWQDAFLYARAFTIAGGSSEIMRNMISERVLAMPRDPK